MSSSRESEDGYLKITDNMIKKLERDKKVIKIVDGKVQIDKSHPDYSFWKED